MNVIEIQDLTKTYGKARRISNISFHVEQREIFGFIGPNIAGKSTTIRTLLSLIYPTSGSAKIFEKDCIKYAPEIKKEIGILRSPFLIPSHDRNDSFRVVMCKHHLKGRTG
jgi:ABC-2 type transport system ATP-binding protein